VGTLAKFLESWKLPPAPPAVLLHLLIEQALERQKPARFAALREFPGLHAALAELIGELPAGSSLSGDLGALAGDVQERLTARGFALRNARLLAAAAHVRNGQAAVPPAVILDGFFTLNSAESALVEAMASRTQVLVTLPEPLTLAGFALERLPGTRRESRRELFSAATPEREAEEIARRILEHAAQGRPFREIGIVLRSRDPYGPLVETTLARFGIPARSYFTDPVTAHPAVAYLTGAVNAMLGGWEHAALNGLLRMPVSGVGATPPGDRFDFELRRKLPGYGLPIDGLKEPPEVLRRFEEMTLWRRERRTPAEWASRLKTLRRLLPEPAVRDGADREDVVAWRSTGAALNAFESAADQVAEVLSGEAEIPLTAFWKPMETALGLEPLRVEDRRRDVVHVMDVFEARQWELPLVFVCGLLERVFPQYHGEDPLLGDALRRRLGMATAVERQNEERFLFDLALTRATERTVLSYSRFNEKGEDTLRSFFLGSEEAEACETRVRPKPLSAVVLPPLAPIEDAALLKGLTKTHRTLSATSIESFLQCPFQFFAGKTLRLKERPPNPRDRLDLLLQGSILHRALAEWIRAPLLGAEVFEQVFQEECERARVPLTYRTEAVRLEMLRHFEGFVADRQVQMGWTTQAEKEFEFTLSPGLKVRGRIDRLEIGPHKQALVIDYKYSAGSKVRERVEQSAAGNLVQGGLYLLAAERALGFDPVGMLYCGLKQGVTWNGWHVPIAGLERIGEARTPEGLQEFMEDTARRVREAQASILSGRVEAQPADTAKCLWCDFRDVCRVEGLGAGSEVGAAG
jgi:ATP-dependent helicase/DNAse subunit B